MRFVRMPACSHPHQASHDNDLRNLLVGYLQYLDNGTVFAKIQHSVETPKKIRGKCMFSID